MEAITKDGLVLVVNIEDGLMSVTSVKVESHDADSNTNQNTVKSFDTEHNIKMEMSIADHSVSGPENDNITVSTTGEKIDTAEERQGIKVNVFSFIKSVLN